MPLNQAVDIINRRLLVVEKFMKESKENPVEHMDATTTPRAAISDEDSEEIEERFNILAEEIHKLKDIVISLQTYTMNVNKMLLENSGAINAVSPAGNNNLYMFNGGDGGDVSVETKED